MAEHEIQDFRTKPPGVLPKKMATLAMFSVGGGLIALAYFGSSTKPVVKPVPEAAPAPLTHNDQVRTIQAQLGQLAEQNRQRQLVALAPEPVALTPQEIHPAAAPATEKDPLIEKRRQKEYDSLFSSSVVARKAAPLATPTLEETAAAVLKASGLSLAGKPPGAPGALPGALPTPPARVPTGHRLLEGSILDAVLTNRLDGGVASPVVAMITNPIYAFREPDVVLIPAGSKAIGETKPVQNFGESRLAVSFHRVIFPNGGDVSLDQFTGLNIAGDSGLHDQVNHHYLSTFGAAAAVGLVSGLGQAVGNVGLGGNRNNTIVVAGGVGNSTSQSMSQVMSRFLNRLPTITIREGFRLKIFITSDLDLPEYKEKS